MSIKHSVECHHGVDGFAIFALTRKFWLALRGKFWLALEPTKDIRFYLHHDLVLDDVFHADVGFTCTRRAVERMEVDDASRIGAVLVDLLEVAHEFAVQVKTKLDKLIRRRVAIKLLVNHLVGIKRNVSSRVFSQLGNNIGQNFRAWFSK